MSSSWSNLPLDLLISIRKKVQKADLLSFRSICSQWHYASAILNPCPLYSVRFNNKNNIIQLTSNFNLNRNHFISLSFSLSSPISFFGCSNGWLIFFTTHHNNETLHLFDPVSNRKLIFPPIFPKLQRYYKKVKPNVYNEYCSFFWHVAVSSSTDASVAVFGIVDIKDRKNPSSFDRRFVFCRHAIGDCQRWSILMEGKGIRDISFAGDGRFYAIREDGKFYILDERPPLIKLLKVKLWLPKHLLDPYSNNKPRPAARRVPIVFYGLKASGETNLNIIGSCLPGSFKRPHISLKINLAELHGNSNNIEVACDASWKYGFQDLEDSTIIFTPSL